MIDNQKASDQQNLPYIISITIAATLGGLLFGYDTAVISGAIGSLRTYFELTAAQTGWAASSALVGCVIGASIAGWIADRFGRKPGLLAAAVLFTVSAIGSAIPDSFTVFIIFRIVGGVGVGIASMLSPMYIAEIAPEHLRGRLVSLNQFAIVLGILVVYFVNYYIALQGDVSWQVETGWRWMFGSETIPAALFFLFMLFVPRSPRWLMLVGQEEKADTVLSKIMNPQYAKKALADIKLSLHRDMNKPKVKIIGQGFGWVVFIGIMLSVFQQITGINVILYYAPEIFSQLGGGTTDSSLLQTIVVGAVNMLFTIVAILTVDSLGRKPLMIYGALGMGICITAVGLTAYYQITEAWILIFMLGYIASFALSLGPVVWVLLSEIFPNQIRGKAMAIAVAAQWISNFLVSQTFPMMMGNTYLMDTFHGGFPFWVYGAMCAVTIWFVWKYVPETKGRKLEDMEELWRKKSDLVPEDEPVAAGSPRR
ncbi:D-xylose transporter XylE [Nafulsella turpanensis]|uniref:D-xylose transporter XylE n=1 Tax=Nafulsella turpanensis TaxID=1265690 RepID=UPI00034A3D95|nr:D-xylose transporter XylE [Nafulsella turpanensis]